jgi:hypothetical protein
MLFGPGMPRSPIPGPEKFTDPGSSGPSRTIPDLPSSSTWEERSSIVLPAAMVGHRSTSGLAAWISRQASR